jgi:hypothetical protein
LSKIDIVLQIFLLDVRSARREQPLFGSGIPDGAMAAMGHRHIHAISAQIGLTPFHGRDPNFDLGQASVPATTSTQYCGS